ncbi:ribonuclease T2-like isoform 2-T3 [Polymixia lowei]
MLRSVLPLLVFLGTAALQQTDTWTRQEHKYGRQNNELNHNKDFCSWKCLKFTLQWPGGFCMELDAELSQQWPSLLHSKSSFHFWREEWHKHGACAACVEGMNSPLLYFHISLKLRQLFDFSKVLDEAGIRPSCTQPYKLAEVHSVLAPLLGDYHQIECVTDDKDREVWFQVKIPLSRNLTLGCEHRDLLQEEPAAGLNPGRVVPAGHPCPPQVPLYYFPIDHQKPHQPCD